jgi:hypothetical protein
VGIAGKRPNEDVFWIEPTVTDMKNAVFWDVAPCGSWFLQEPHGVTSQKTTIFIATAVKTLYLT